MTKVLSAESHKKSLLPAQVGVTVERCKNRRLYKDDECTANALASDKI